MAYKYLGDAVLGVSLTIETPKPLDSRTVVNNLDELYSIPEKYAYQGMTVANIDNGNIYMLIDKSKIRYKEGWKASYESIQIITCTEAEYKEWQSNTTVDFKPKDESKDYLHQETYYYIYEDSLDDNQFYLSAEWGKRIEALLGTKANADGVNTKINEVKDSIEQNRIYSENTYVPKTYFDLENPDSFLSKTLSGYYTQQETDDIFVTKESLRGEGIEGDDFVFVTKTQYDKDQDTIWQELDKTLKVDGDGQLESITVGQIKSPQNESGDQLVVDVTPGGLFIQDDQIATISDIPNMVTLPEEEYLQLVENGEIQPDTYYYVYDVENSAKVYITKEYLDLNYHTTNQYQSWISNRYYSRTQIDDIVSGLQKLGSYVTTEDIKNYYTSQQVNDLFLTQVNASNTYITKQQVSEEYVTKESLRGDSADAGNDDFIFVTQKKYQEDQVAASNEFTTKSLITNIAKTSDLTIQKIVKKEIQQESPEDNTGEEIVESQVNLTTENNRLLVSGKQVANIEEVPKLVCLPQTDYEELIQNNNTQEDTYYYTYGETNIQDTGYVRSEYLQERYYTKTEVQELINSAIAKLQEKIDSIESSSGNTQVDEQNEQLRL